MLKKDIRLIEKMRHSGDSWEFIANHFTVILGYDSISPDAMRMKYNRAIKDSKTTELKAPKEPEILYLDIETAPMLGYVWSLWNNDLGLNQVHSDWYILSWSAKWKGDDKVMYEDQSKQADMENDKQIVKNLRKLINAADIIVTHNGKKFDIKKINSRLLYHGLKPLMPVKHVDTYQIARSKFGFTSNKLEYLVKHLKIGMKRPHKKYPGFELWTECLAGNKDAWKEMKEYNVQDTIILERLHEKLDPWDSTYTKHQFNPNSPKCTCGSTDIIKKGYRYTAAGKYQRYVCNDCGKTFSGGQNLYTKEERRNILRKTNQS